MFKFARSMFVVLAAVVGLSAAQASVVISGTRVVFPGGEREVTVKLTNDGEIPALVQAWIDRGNPNSMPDEVSVPFLLSPPLFRMEPKKGQSLRMVFTGEDLPKDKESIFWLNVLEVPPRAAAAEEGAGQMQIAFRNRIKIFYRPKGLSMRVDDAPAKMQWQIVTGADGKRVLQGSNPTPFFINLSHVAAEIGGKSYVGEQGGMAAPGGNVQFPLLNLPVAPAGALKVKYRSINDYGASVDGQSGAAD
jgi:chaperone protein EcpD